MPKATIIVAMDRHGGIGAKGTLPWRVRSEMQHFYNTTTHAPAGKINAVIMGRRTWESLPHRLSKRLNIVVSRRTQPGVHDGALWVNSLEDALTKADEFGDVHIAFIIGGTSLFGGKGSIIGTLAGACILQVLATGLQLLGIGDNYKPIIIGAVIVMAVGLDKWRQGRTH